MIKTEYDNIDELVQDDIDEIDDYESAKEANDLLMDALKLTDFQKSMLKGSFGYLEDMLRKQIMAEMNQNSKYFHISNRVFRFDDRAYGNDRIIIGQEIIDWIQRNHLQQRSIYCGTDSLFVRMLDEQDELHYKETFLYWGKDHAKYEVIENWLEKE